MRTPAEFLFRLRQEAANLALLVRPPAPPSDTTPALPGLPDPETVAARLRDTGFRAEIEELAEQILAHRFPLLGCTIETGSHIDWRRDYVRGIRSAAAYFRRVPYLDPARTGDHKIIWELNRHQHLIVLAQAFLLTGQERFLREIRAQVESWIEANPFLRGINWTSALEVGFRALSWLWVWRLAGDRLDPEFRRRLAGMLYLHGLYLERNLSVYFSPNTHLLGEAVALHALGRAFAGQSRARRWQQVGHDIVVQQMERQVRADGTHFEQSSYYHLYALDLFLFHHLLAGSPAGYQDKLRRMAEYLDCLMGPGGRLPLIGDDDGGRFFHPYGVRERFGRATLATCGVLFGEPSWIRQERHLYEQACWWLRDLPAREPAPPPARYSRLFGNAGVAVFDRGRVQVIVDAGPFGFGGAGHSHSDTLSLVVRHGAEELLVDAGTCTYAGDTQWRDWFRGTAAHNTIRVDGRDQASAAGPFRWQNHPGVRILDWRTGKSEDFLDALCCFGAFTHRRRVMLRDGAWLAVLDTVEGPPGPHLVEQFWHIGEPIAPLAPRCFRVGLASCLALPEPFEPELSCSGGHAWRSRVYGHHEPCPVVRVHCRAQLPLVLAAVWSLSAKPLPFAVRLEGERLTALPAGGEVVFDFGSAPRQPEPAGLARYA